MNHFSKLLVGLACLACTTMDVGGAPQQRQTRGQNPRPSPAPRPTLAPSPPNRAQVQQPVHSQAAPPAWPAPPIAPRAPTVSHPLPSILHDQGEPPSRQRSSSLPPTPSRLPSSSTANPLQHRLELPRTATGIPGSPGNGGLTGHRLPDIGPVRRGLPNSNNATNSAGDRLPAGLPGDRRSIGSVGSAAAAGERTLQDARRKLGIQAATLGTGGSTTPARSGTNALRGITSTGNNGASPGRGGISITRPDNPARMPLLFPRRPRL
jgi:hypothetical protein